ncbi:hypothetical protein [Mesorhizobium sp. M0619]|uniref:hypothetical protein n=1 Tax=unclassified Mesorhizobium TaxID=325217 RepID=UPI00333BFAD8
MVYLLRQHRWPGRRRRYELLGVGDNFKPIVLGLVIVLAVILDAHREKLLRVIR